VLCSSSLIPSPLLRLPAELRIAIYDYVFGDIFYHLNVHRGPVKTYSSFNACNLGLIAASRQLHSETRLLPYKLGIFTFHVAIPDRSEDYRSFRINSLLIQGQRNRRSLSATRCRFTQTVSNTTHGRCFMESQYGHRTIGRWLHQSSWRCSG